jgi:release factor glutamine methyltransferase
MAELGPEVRDWEPKEALQAGPRGTEAIAAILDGAPRWLTASGAAVVEIAPHQAPEAQALARSVGLATTEVHPDLAGRRRVLVARR